MIAVDLESYFRHSGTAREGVRLMQWANYVKRRIPGLTAAQEMLLLEGDERLMGCKDWWFK